MAPTESGKSNVFELFFKIPIYKTTKLNLKIHLQKIIPKNRVSEAIKTGEDSKFFGISTEFTPFSNKGKDLVIQYTMKHSQDIECGGGYMKVGPKPDDLTKFGDPKGSMQLSLKGSAVTV